MSDPITAQWIIDVIMNNRGKLIYVVGVVCNFIITYRRLPTQDSPLWYVIFYCLLMLGTGNLSRTIAAASAKAGADPGKQDKLDNIEDKKEKDK